VLPHFSRGFPSIRGLLLSSLFLSAACSGNGGTGGPQEETYPEVDRYAAIPEDAVKVTPSHDPHPPILHSTEFEEPVPLPGPVNSAGAEDAPFIPASGEALYFFFAADARQDASLQIRDPVNGIWVARRAGDSWQEPELVWLQEPDVLALNGCPFVAADTMYFCTVREGLAGLQWFTAENDAGVWTGWAPATIPPQFEVGELHIYGDELYFDSSRPGGRGGKDIWTLTRSGESWADPENVGPVNSGGDEIRPYVSPDGLELWITRSHQGSPALFRSRLQDGEWEGPELVVSSFAGEATLDPEGNLYFAHHFYRDGMKIEADIYVAYRR
jgi:hypothetical protein